MKSTIKNKKNIYLVGIKGGGMTALALLLQGMGKNIIGSDTTEKFYTDKVLKDHNINFFENFDPTNLTNQIDLVVYSTAYDPNVNKICLAAKEKNIPLLSYPEALAELIKNKKTLAVAGTHGKTTTTAWLAYILKLAGFDPSAIVGSNVPQFSGSTLVGKSDWLVVETDEYQNKFNYYFPQVITLNNIDWDHPDFFKNESDYISVFRKYIEKLPSDGFLVAGIDNKNVYDLVKNFKGKLITFAIDKKADWQIKCLRIENNFTIFDVYFKDIFWHKVKIQLKGDFNILNALSALATAVELQADKSKVILGLEKFLGTERRFEKKGQIKNSLIYDDFAHHPTEIQATLQMCKKYFPDKKIRVVFHPHTFTRTLQLKDDFIKSFTRADEVLVLDIYGSAREQQGGISSLELTEQINKLSKNAIYVKDISGAVNYLQERLVENNLIVTMGAGDVWRVGENLLNLNNKYHE